MRKYNSTQSLQNGVQPPQIRETFLKIVSQLSRLVDFTWRAGLKREQSTCESVSSLFLCSLHSFLWPAIADNFKDP